MGSCAFESWGRSGECLVYERFVIKYVVGFKDMQLVYICRMSRCSFLRLLFEFVLAENLVRGRISDSLWLTVQITYTLILSLPRRHRCAFFVTITP